MTWTLNKALEDDLITVVSRDDTSGLYKVKVGDLSTVVTITLKRQPNTRRTDFRVSHAIHTPMLNGPYHTSLPFGDDAAHALHSAITGLTMWYHQALEKGHKPIESWLVGN